MRGLSTRTIAGAERAPRRFMQAPSLLQPAESPRTTHRVGTIRRASGPHAMGGPWMRSNSWPGRRTR
jgi:hypothetical protein